MADRTSRKSIGQQNVRSCGKTSARNGESRQAGGYRKTLRLVGGTLIALATAASYMGCNGSGKLEVNWGYDGKHHKALK
jgi:hypothetical protein